MKRARLCMAVTIAALLTIAITLISSVPSAPVHMGQLPARAWHWGTHNSYLRTRPSLVEQHRRGMRLFEIDAYWWLGSTWLVAHVPVIDSSSYVRTVEEAVCTLRQLGDGATMMLDIKNVVWQSCEAGAMQELRRQLNACVQTGPLRVLVDVSCASYSNVQCARSLRGSAIANTTLLYRGIDFWWLSAGQSGSVSHGASCDEFTEPASWIYPTKPVLLQCAAAMPVCVKVAAEQSATWLQTSTTPRLLHVRRRLAT